MTPKHPKPLRHRMTKLQSHHVNPMQPIADIGETPLQEEHNDSYCDVLDTTFAVCCCH